ncbi:MAG TPA: PDZ domain-containing protein [Acidimicrobiales bacterium]|nr:PDZ domain-containing protein [Acidimicrobiales bacterium]
MSSTDLALPPAPPGVEPRRWPARRRRRFVALGVSMGLLVSTLVGAAVLPVPYVALRPGTARPVTEQVLVEGAPSYPPEQSIAYTTVSVGGTTLLEALVGWLDDDVDVFPERVVRGDRDEEENRRYNAQLMDTSKLVAVAVALRHLGYDVSVHTTGTVVRQIAEDSPAAAVLQLDDVIVAVDGSAVDEPDEVGPLLQPGGPGATHTLTVERPPGSGTTLDVTLATVPAPDDPQRAIIGIAPEDRIVGADFPIDVLIDSGTVGGPSAGLAFTLAVLDVLTPGELTGGHRVAVTGTIRLDGVVGPVGGAAQKAISVRDAGYEVFLVPPAERAEVEAAVGDDLQVIEVGTLAQALEALDALGGNAGSLAGAAAGP